MFKQQGEYEMFKKRWILSLVLIVMMASGSILTVIATTNLTGESEGQITFEPDDTPNLGDIRNPENPDDPFNPHYPGHIITGSDGALRIEAVPNFMFGQHVINTSNRMFPALVPRGIDVDEVDRHVPHFVQIGDWRGTGQGWTLSAQLSSQFSGGGWTLTGAQIHLRNIGALSASPAVSPTSSNIRPTEAVLRYGNGLVNLVRAGENEGMGITSVRFGNYMLGGGDAVAASNSVFLSIPPSTQIFATTYVATITWRLVEGPMGSWDDSGNNGSQTWNPPSGPPPGVTTEWRPMHMAPPVEGGIITFRDGFPWSDIIWRWDGEEWILERDNSNSHITGSLMFLMGIFYRIPSSPGMTSDWFWTGTEWIPPNRWPVSGGLRDPWGVSLLSTHPPGVAYDEWDDFALVSPVSDLRYVFFWDSYNAQWWAPRIGNIWQAINDGRVMGVNSGLWGNYVDLPNAPKTGAFSFAEAYCWDTYNWVFTWFMLSDGVWIAENDW